MSTGLSSAARIGRVAMRVRDLAGVVSMYADVVGLAILDESTDRAVLGVDGTPLLVLCAAPDAPERGSREAGVFHVAFRVPSRAALGAALRRLEDRWRMTGASDHLVSEAIYARDPAGNGIEIYRDRPPSEWVHRSDGTVEIGSMPLDRDGIIRAFSGSSFRDGGNAFGAGEDVGHSVDADLLPPGSDVGHVHLETIDLDEAVAFYTDVVGLRVRDVFGDEAAFLAAGEYHHHLGLNVWGARTETASTALGLMWYEFVVPESELIAVRERLADAGHSTHIVGEGQDGFETRAPDGIRIRFRPAGLP